MSDTGTPRVWRRLALAFVDPQSYGLVILLIIASYLVSVNVTQAWTGSLVLFVQIATVWFALRTAKTHRHVRTIASVLLAIAAVAALVGVVKADGSRPFLLALSCLLYLLAPFAIVRHIAERPGVDRETVLGAIAAYLLLGMFFGFLYRLLGEVQEGPFFGTAGAGTLSQVLFFSFTTLTTTGYGNLVPAENPGQTIAVMEMILGQLFLITAVGKIIAEWRPTRWRSADDPAAEAGE